MNLATWTQRLAYTIGAATLAATLVGCASSQQRTTVEDQQSESTNAAQAFTGHKELNIKVLHKANYNPYERNNGKSFRALDSLAKYRAELRLHSIETAKPVDYKTSQILVSSIGRKPTGGYKVTATKAEEFEDRVVVTVISSAPGPGCITTQALTYPYEFVVIPSRKPIQISEQQKMEAC